MERHSYRCTATVGWRTAGWPFGVFEVADDALTLNSWHWSWWLREVSIGREHLESVALSVFSGAAIFTIRPKSEASRRLSVSPVGASTKRAILVDLAQRGYHVVGIGQAGQRMLAETLDGVL